MSYILRESVYQGNIDCIHLTFVKVAYRCYTWSISYYNPHQYCFEIYLCNIANLSIFTGMLSLILAKTRRLIVDFPAPSGPEKEIIIPFLFKILFILKGNPTIKNRGRFIYHPLISF